jgi:hypothetical protein
MTDSLQLKDVIFHGGIIARATEQVDERIPGFFSWRQFRRSTGVQTPTLEGLELGLLQEYNIKVNSRIRPMMGGPRNTPRSRKVPLSYFGFFLRFPAQMMSETYDIATKR